MRGSDEPSVGESGRSEPVLGLIGASSVCLKENLEVRRGRFGMVNHSTSKTRRAQMSGQMSEWAIVVKRSKIK